MIRRSPFQSEIFPPSSEKTSNAWKAKPSKTSSFKKQCIEQLKETNLTGIPSIVTSRRFYRLLIKLLILSIGIAGFLLQTHEFLEMYWQYTTVASTKRMSYMKMPAITICDENLIRRDVFCEMWPRWCIPLPDGVCIVLPEYCYDPRDIYPNIVDVKYEKFKEMFNMSYIKALGFNIEKKILQCEWISKESSKSSPCGKPEFLRVLNKEKLPAVCYTLKSNTYMLDEELKYDTVLQMIVAWRPSELSVKAEDLISTNIKKRNYWMDFHHSEYLNNPFENGFKIQEGRNYEIQVTEVDTIRLPSPYSTDCFDYVKEWKRSQFKGPLRREDCEGICEINALFDSLGCVPNDLPLPHDKPFCMEHKPFNEELTVKLQNCTMKCRDACEERKYITSTRVVDVITVKTGLKKFDAPTVAILNVTFDVLKSQIVEYRPKYESVEVFSYVGGYLGMWLGWCLLAIFDFFEIIFILILNLYKDIKKEKKKNIVQPFAGRQIPY